LRRSAFALIVVLSLAAVGAVAFTAVNLSSRHITAWVMTQDASAGTPLTPLLVHQATIPQGSDDFTVLTAAPKGAYLSHAVARGDVLRPDDLFTQAMVTVPLSFKSLAPGLQAGDTVDIYGPGSAAASGVGTPQAPQAAASDASGQSVQLYGRGIAIVAGGTASAVLVPAAYEGFWVDLSVSGIDLVAVKSSGVQVPRGQTYTLQQAEQMLAAIASGNAAQPSASGSGS
jgi:hypothetical protein